MTSKQKLLSLEAEGKYLFHGSGLDLDMLEPRQAHNFEHGMDLPEGEPAVFATPSMDYAILMALVNDHNCPQGYRAGATSLRHDNGSIELKLRMSAKTFSELDEEDFGYVYVLDTERFAEKWPKEWISYESCKPLEKIRVTKVDLSSDIEIFEG